VTAKSVAVTVATSAGSASMRRADETGVWLRPLARLDYRGRAGAGWCGPGGGGGGRPHVRRH